METVLIAETEPANLLALSLVLRSLGYAVLEADTQDGALFACRDYPGTIHAVVTSRVLEHRRNSLIPQLRLLRPQLRVLVISEPAECLAQTDSDDCIFLRKPFQLEDLADSMRILLGREYRDIASSYRNSDDWQFPEASCKSIAGFAFGQFSPAMRAMLMWSCVALVLTVLVPIVLLSRRGSSVSSPPSFGGPQTLTPQSRSDKSDQAASAPRSEIQRLRAARTAQMLVSHHAHIEVRAPNRRYRRVVPAEHVNQAATAFPARSIRDDASAKEGRAVPPPEHFSEPQSRPTPNPAMRANSDGEPALGAFPSVSVQARAEPQPSGLARKISPLFRGFRHAPEFKPPSPIRKSTPVIGAAFGHRLESEVSLDVRVYINKSGRVDYAELLTDITDRNRDFATLAVFDARHWVFAPARSGTRIVQGRAILSYQFGAPEFAASHDQN